MLHAIRTLLTVVLGMSLAGCDLLVDRLAPNRPPSIHTIDVQAVELVLVGNRLLLATKDGRAEVYEFRGGAWKRTTELTPEGEAAGRVTSVAMHGNRALLGTPGAESAHLFEWDGAMWQNVARLSVDSLIAASDSLNERTYSFGFAVALDEDEAFVSAPGSDG